MRKIISLVSISFLLLLVSCENQEISSPESTDSHNHSFIAKVSGDKSAVNMDHISKLVDEVNAVLEKSGSSMRLTEGWFFTVGHGTDPYMRLRTGSKWIPKEVGYVLDESDYTTDVPFSEVDAALTNAYDSWNNIANTYITATKVADDGSNFDVLDGTYDANGDILTLWDIASPNLDLANGLIYPYTNIVVGGWINPNYFSQGLGSSNIIGVTWTWSDVDASGDNYRDRLYVEQYYNPAFLWTTTDAVYLDFTAPMDIETIAVHENGHAMGLGHFGGPLVNQPFKLKPNGRVFNPEAVMNPFYLGGENRVPMHTDVAGMRTMYAGK